MLADHEPGVRTGRNYPEMENAVIMTVYTRAPSKWLLVDRETGEVYEGNSQGSWDRYVPDPEITDAERLKNVNRLHP